jgi:hypothetical protein
MLSQLHVELSAWYRELSGFRVAAVSYRLLVVPTLNSVVQPKERLITCSYARWPNLIIRCRNNGFAGEAWCTLRAWGMNEVWFVEFWERSSQTKGYTSQGRYIVENRGWGRSSEPAARQVLGS